MKARVTEGAVSVTVVVPELAPESGAVGPTAAARTPDTSPLSSLRKAGVAIGSLGVVGVIVGAVFGVQAITKNNQSKAQCAPTDPSFCNDQGVTLRQDAKTAGTASTVAFVAGAALITGGVVLVVLPPSKSKDSLSGGVAVRAGGLVLRGTW
jgi:hypothetical protein